MSVMSTYHVKSLYSKGSKKPYVREIINKYTNEIEYTLYFDHYPSWDEIVDKVKKEDVR